LQDVRALASWRTQKMAKMDAAFEAYKKLYEAGLVNEHLLPPVLMRSQETAVHEHRDSINEVTPALDPWD
ncbi:MAG: hypothetical protein M1823_007866, partial [Watsoniomyces obsoletus]